MKTHTHEHHHHAQPIPHLVHGEVTECGQWLQITYTPNAVSQRNTPGFWLIRCQAVTMVFYCAASRQLRIEGATGTVFQEETPPDEAKPIIEALAAAIAMEARAVR